MEIRLPNKDEFVNSFLTPLNKISESCVLKLQPAGFTSLLAAADNTVVVHGAYSCEADDDADLKLNVPDIARLIRVLQCIDSQSITLVVDGNKIKYTSSDIRFTYHLLHDGILSLPPLSLEKIKKLEFDTTLKVPCTSINNLIKSSTFTLNINKVYFFTKDGSVYAEINDMQSQNVDSICIKLCDSYEGEDIEKPLPVSFDTIRTLSSVKCQDMNIKINKKLNVMTFGINNNNVAVKYIVSGLVK